MNTPWRLIITPPAAGDWNMAVDEAILESSGRGEVPPTLRLFAWAPPCLSLGYAQPVGDADRQRLEDRGWGLVRRPTGGRAILHTDELTYSVVGPADEPRLIGSVLESYRRLSAALLDALHRLDVPAQAKAAHSLPAGSDRKAAVCFEVPSNYEITVNGKKLIGSAQARRKEGVLQHGSLPLCGDLTRITQALAFADEDARARAAQRLLARAVTVEMVLGHPVTWEAAAQAYIAAFQCTLDLELQPAELTPFEQARAIELVREKYGNEEWTGRV